MPPPFDPIFFARALWARLVRERVGAITSAFVVVVALLAALPSSAFAAMSIPSGPTIRVNPYQTTIWWHSSSSGSSELVWDTSNKGDWANFTHDISNTNTDLGTIHSRTISNLAAGTYYFRVRSTGADGTATSAAHSFSVSEPDASVPLGSLVVDEGVAAIAATNDRVYIAGPFTQIGPRLGSGIALSATDASQAHAGNPQVAGTVRTSVPDGAGGIYIGGVFQTVGGLPRGQVAHLLPDGGVDPYFTTGPRSASWPYQSGFRQAT